MHAKLAPGGETTKRFGGIPEMRFTPSLSGTAGADSRREWRQSRRLTRYGRAAGSARHVRCAAQHDGKAQNRKPASPTRASLQGEPRMEYTQRSGLSGLSGWTLNCQQRSTNFRETVLTVSGGLPDDHQPMNSGKNPRCRDTGEHEPRHSSAVSVSGSSNLSLSAHCTR
jgi:hypothetical protein